MIALTELRPYTGDVVAPSPNHGARQAHAIEGIVLHATGDDGDETTALVRLRSADGRGSCHLLVGRDGGVVRLVGDRRRAWHAGDARWRGKRDVNSITLGIAIANRNDGEPYTDAQYRRVAEVVAHYCRQGLTPGDVVSHGDIALPRRAEPLGWDWHRFLVGVQGALRTEAALPGPRAPRGEVQRQRPRATTPVSAPPAPRTPTPVAPAVTRAKPAVCSRTLWVNALTVLAAGSVIAAETLDLAFSVGMSVPEEITMWVLFAIGAVNILLRFQTTCPIAVGGREAMVPAPMAPARGPG